MSVENAVKKGMDAGKEAFMKQALPFVVGAFVIAGATALYVALKK
ncbi:hypothetical protein Mpet_2314 [Methanolacinia petrolearia DSM 11571]|uniref:Uncharacterized protein n=1 Tax=Methanolacinia petrolearia (strain DSM 11571 / OCM 486 / SEBR 4847) TaxID=679926 RepID=E1RD78_METP4|nr:hypothetical protein [Methanolacinia petrolearia]ADN37061.1 hypothetical protein Mpet_2314 [Methanolacinia petrolearia DSM 11571]